MELTSDTLRGFSESLLAARYDSPQPTPDFHMELWDLFLRDDPFVAAAAPRGHAKSTAITHAYGLAMALFRKADNILIISNTEGQATQFLGDIKNELQENEDLAQLFGIEKFLKENEKEIIVQTKDRHRFRFVAKGSGQSLRGTKWLGKRPNLVIGDDLEDDDIVMNQDRRLKFKNWFYATLIPALSDYGKIRIVGTILHLDSLLEGLLSDSEWVTERYEAHDMDFSPESILWPQKFPITRLKQIYQTFVNQGIPEKYYQEYLNLPIDPHNAYFKETDFIDIKEDYWDRPRNYYAAVDFAISSSNRADRTVISVGGFDSDGILNIEHVSIGRWDAKEIVDEMMAIQQRFEPEIFTMEGGMIEKSIGPYLNDEMLRRNIYINVNREIPTKDKETRARSIQGRMRAGGVRFDMDAPWYNELHDEMITFPRGKHDDIVDSIAWLGLTLDKFADAPTPEEQDELDWEEEFEETFDFTGVSAVTGY